MTDQINSFLPSETTVADADRLRGAVADMAAITGEYSSQIQAIARTAYLALETPWGAGDTETLAHLLSVIENLADDLRSAITNDAERVGITTRDDRMAARCEALDTKRDLARGGARHGG